MLKGDIPSQFTFHELKIIVNNPIQNIIMTDKKEAILNFIQTKKNENSLREKSLPVLIA